MMVSARVYASAKSRRGAEHSDDIELAGHTCFLRSSSSRHIQTYSNEVEWRAEGMGDDVDDRDSKYETCD